MMHFALAWIAAAALPLTDVTKEDVLRLLAAQVGDEAIVSYIRSNPPGPRLTTRDVIELKEAGASDRVITALMEPPPTPALGSNRTGPTYTYSYYDGGYPYTYVDPRYYYPYYYPRYHYSYPRYYGPYYGAHGYKHYGYPHHHGHKPYYGGHHHGGHHSGGHHGYSGHGRHYGGQGVHGAWRGYSGSPAR